MNYHLMFDDKFIDDFISDVEKLSPGKNQYFVRTDRDLKYVKHPSVRCVQHLPDFFINNVIPALQTGDCVYIHCLEYRYYQLVNALPPFVKLGVFFWGGEYVEFPESIYAKSLYERKTYWFFLRFMHPIPTYLRVYKNPWNIVRHFIRKSAFEKEQRRLNNEKLRVLPRIDYFFHWNIKDYEWLQNQCPDFKAKFIYHFYSGGLYTEFLNRGKGKEETLLFWLGNSATLANNHLDALRALSKFRGRRIKVICPLSYGEPLKSRYTKAVLQYGSRKFGEEFQPLTEFLAREKYYNLFSSSDIIIMWHNRTQGAANVFAGLLAGKKVFMQAKSTLFQLLVDSGLTIYSCAELHKLSFEELRASLSPAIAEKNQFLIRTKILSTELKERELKRWFL